MRVAAISAGHCDGWMVGGVWGIDGQKGWFSVWVECRARWDRSRLD